MLQLSDEQRAVYDCLYAELAAQYPKSAAVQRITLTFLQGEPFKLALDAYMKVLTCYTVHGVPTITMSSIISLCCEGVL